MRTHQKAFSLVEILVVIFILVLVGGLLLPILSRSKAEALKADDIARLRQIGMAQQIYHESYQGRYSLSVIPLVESQLLPKELAASLRDHSPEGLANVMAAQNLEMDSEFIGRRASFKSSFIGIEEQGWSQEYFVKNILDGKNPGWLVNVVETVPGTGSILAAATGPYHRLCLDGSVQRRTQSRITVIDDGKEATGVHPVLLYVDEDAEWIDRKKL